jgi:hypothetical protein
MKQEGSTQIRLTTMFDMVTTLALTPADTTTLIHHHPGTAPSK